MQVQGLVGLRTWHRLKTIHLPGEGKVFRIFLHHYFIRGNIGIYINPAGNRRGKDIVHDDICQLLYGGVVKLRVLQKFPVFALRFFARTAADEKGYAKSDCTKVWLPHGG